MTIRRRRRSREEITANNVHSDSDNIVNIIVQDNVDITISDTSDGIGKEEVSMPSVEVSAVSSIPRSSDTILSDTHVTSNAYTDKTTGRFAQGNPGRPTDKQRAKRAEAAKDSIASEGEGDGFQQLLQGIQAEASSNVADFAAKLRKKSPVAFSQLLACLMKLDSTGSGGSTDRNITIVTQVPGVCDRRENPSQPPVASDAIAPSHNVAEPVEDRPQDNIPRSAGYRSSKEILDSLGGGEPVADRAEAEDWWRDDDVPSTHQDSWKPWND